MKRKKLVYLVVTLIVVALLGGCSGLRGKSLTYMTNKKYEPYKGQVQVFWKEHRTPIKGTYAPIATITGKPMWAGIYTARSYQPLHQYIIDKAAEVGGNGVIIYCGEVGTVGESTCYGDAIWLY